MKKITNLIMSGILGLSLFLFTGCSDNEVVENNEELQIVEEKEQREQEQQVEDEDLNEEYKYKYEDENDLEKGKELMEDVAYSIDGYEDIRWKIETDEKSNTVIFKVDIDSNTVSYGIRTGEWNGLVETWTETCATGKLLFEKKGLDINYSIWLGDFDSDSYYLGILNGKVFFNVEDKLN